MCDDMLVIPKAAILFVIWFVICPSLISFPSSVCNLQATAAVYQSFCSRWVDWLTQYQKDANMTIYRFVFVMSLLEGSVDGLRH